MPRSTGNSAASIPMAESLLPGGHHLPLHQLQSRRLKGRDCKEAAQPWPSRGREALWLSEEGECRHGRERCGTYGVLVWERASRRGSVQTREVCRGALWQERKGQSVIVTSHCSLLTTLRSAPWVPALPWVPARWPPSSLAGNEAMPPHVC